MLSDGVDASKLDQETGEKFDLSTFVKDLLGLDAKAVDAAFASFINDNAFNDTQISFLETIKKFLTQNGELDPEKLYEPPFRDVNNPQGVDNFFNEDQADRIFEIVRQLNEAN